MAKSIKKSFKYLIIFLGIIIMFPTLVAIILQIPKIQTLMVKRITNHFSEQIRSTISVSKFEYRFFNSLTLNDLLIKDKHSDTLIYVQKLYAGIKHVDLTSMSFTFGKVDLINPVLGLITDSAGQMNLAWYLDMLKKPADTTSKSKGVIKINEVEINNARVSVINKKGIKSKNPIDFNNLQLKEVNGIIEGLIVKNDTTSFNINNLGFRELSGFRVRKLNSGVTLSKNNYALSSVYLNCDSSTLNFDHLELHADSAGSFKKFAEEVRLDILMEKSLISFSDIKYFVASVAEVNQSFWLSAKLLGTLAELRGRDIELSYADHTMLSCDFDLSGLPKIENSFIYLGVNSLETDAADLEKINIPGKGFLKLPEFFPRLGTISFDGSFTGFTTDFVTYGNLRTNIGTIRTDISVRPEKSKRFKIKGLVSLSDIAIGELTGKPDQFGKISMKADVDGYAFSLKKYSGSLTGRIDSVEINKYKYRNISLNGNFSEKMWDGTVNITEDNIRMDILGLFNFKEKLPEFDFTLNLTKANLYKLNFDKSDTSSSLSMMLTANFRGTNIDNVNGEIKMLNSSFKKFSDTLELNNFSIRTFSENNKPAISLSTDYIDADLRGYYNFDGLGILFKSTLSALMPTEFKSPIERHNLVKNNFTFKINFKKTDKLFNFFHTGLLLADKSSINGAIFTDSIMTIRGDSKMLNFKNFVFKDLVIEANLLKPGLKANLTSSSLNLLGKSEIKGFAANLTTHPDTFNFALNWDNHDKILNSGNFSASGVINKTKNTNSKPLLNILIDSTEIYVNNNLWKINRSTITIDTTSVRFDKFYITNKSRFYHIDGAISANTADSLLLEFREIDISPLNSLTSGNSTVDQVPLSFKGKLNGRILFTNVFKQPLIVSNLNVNNFSMLQSEYGDVSITSEWNNESKVADIHALNMLSGKKNINISGHYDPEAKYLNLNGIADNLPIGALNPLLKTFASGINGTASGKVNLSGVPGKLVLKGALMVENAGIKIDYLQTKYKINDSIRFDKNSIIFNNVRANDERGNTAVLNGFIHHNYFKDFAADIVLNTKDCMVLNTRQKDNNLFYGTAFASGVTTIKSGPGSVSVDISAKTGKNTKFYIPLNTSETISDYSFVSFISHDTIPRKEEDQPNQLPSPVAKTLIDLNLDLEVTPDAEVQIIFDPKVGDIMKGHGSARNLTISYDKQGNFKIYGDYVIEDGDYLFTLKNVLNKSFSVENGGKIIFNGDIYNAGIEVKAIYKTRASLYELLGDEKFKEKIPVECQINLSGKLFNPIVNLDIYLPTADESTRAYLKTKITTDEELSRQFLYLLVMNSFYSDPSLYGGSSASGLSTTATGTSAMAVTTTEMVSNQLSNWLSQISNDFDIGFVYRPGYKDINSNEVQLALSTQLLNDKVVINGNFDVKGPGNASTNPQQLIGDFDIEYKITDKIRFKVFNRFNDPYTGKLAPYTQGFGLFYKEDFDKLSDILNKKKKSDMKKEDDTVPAAVKR
jgi:hypothetical protein